MRIFGKGFNFSQDGPGNRLVYHISGCNLRCPWCSNPEGMSGSAGSITSCEEIVDEAIRSAPMFFGGGGVTFTGGEATLAKTELMQILEALQQKGIHTAIETNGTTDLKAISHAVDYMIMDFKHFDGDRLAEVTGLGNHTLKKNFEYFCSVKRQLHIRIPLINGFNTDNPRGFAEYFSSHNTENVVFEFLPYHEMGKSKWTAQYTVTDGFVSDTKLNEFKSVFTEYRLTVKET